MIVGERIKELRVLAEMSQEELGRRVGLQRAAIQKYEKGTVENIPIKTIEKLSEVFDVSPVYIVGWDGVQDNPTAFEVRVIQGVKAFYGVRAVELLETYTKLDQVGKERLLQYSEDISKVYS